MTPNISNQVVEEEEKEDEEVLLNIPSMDNFFIENNTPGPVIVKDNQSFNNQKLILKTNNNKPLIQEVINYNSDEEFILEETQNPEESDFFINTQKITSEFENIIQNPVLNDKSTILPSQSDALDLDFEETQEINVTATMEKLSTAALNLPKIVNYNIEEKVENIPTFNFSENPEEDTTRFYTPTSEVKDYIKNSILTETGRDFKNIMTWEDFVAEASKVTDKIMQKDPLIKQIFGEAKMVLKNEGQAKYIEMLNTAREENGLDTPEEIEALQSQYNDWENKRWNELMQTTSFDNRAQQYQFATRATLEELYKPFGRSKDESLAEIDRQLKSGEISETWWALKDKGIGTWRGFPEKWNVLDVTAKKSNLNEFANEISYYNKNKETLEKLGILDLDEKDFKEKLRLAGFTQFKRKPVSQSAQMSMAYAGKDAAKLMKNSKKYDDDYPTTLEYENSLKDLTQEEKELMLESYNILYKSRTSVTAGDATGQSKTLRNNMDRIIERQSSIVDSTIAPTIEILKSQNFQKLLNQTDPDDDGIVDTVNQILGQSNMILTVGGELTAMVGSKIKNPLGVAMYTGGKLASLLGTADIAAQEFGSGIWGTFDANIRKRKGENYQPTLDDYLAELEDPDSVSIIQNIITTGGIVALERLGLSKILGATKMTSKNLASLLRGEYKTWLKTLPALVYQREIAGGIEFVTEGSQGYISDANIRFGSGDSLGQSISEAEFDMLGAKKGRQIGRFLPVVGQITKQTAIELNAAALKLSTNFDLGKYSQTFKSTELFFNQSIEKIQKDVDSNKISQEDGQLAIRNISNIRNAGMKIPANIDGRSKPRLMRLLLEQQALQNKIKEVDNKDLSANDILELATVSSQIQGIVKKADSRDNYIKQVGNVVNIINNNENANVKIIRSKDDKAVESQIDKLNSEGWKIAASKGLTTNYGTIFQKGDQQVILLNDKEILADGAINTAAHEFLHAVLWNTVKNSKGTALALGNDLVKYLKDVNPELIKNSVFAKRLQQYKDDPTVTNEQQAEEVLTLFSEAALDGAIELNEGALDQIQGFFTRIFNSLIGREANLTFNSGKDVFKFIKGYNESIKKGKFTTAQNKLFEGRAEGDLIKREYKTKDIKDRDTDSKSSQGFDKTNELFADPDFEATNRFDQKKAVEAAGGVIEAATQRLWRQGSLLTRDQFKKALENEYVQALVEYDSDRDTGTGAGSSISSKFNLRAGGVAKANLGKGESLSLDSEQAKQVADRTEQREFDEVESKENTQRKKVYSSNTNQVGNLDTAETKAIIKEEVSKDILLSANKGNNAADTARIIANEAKQNYFKKLRKDIGTFSSQTYKDFVNSLDKNFIKSLPVSIIKRRFGKLFGIKQTGIAKTKQTSKTGKPSYFNKPVFSVPKVTSEGLQQFKDYFLVGEKRQQSLYNILATDFALESMQELMSDKTFMDKLQTSLGNQGITAKEFMQNIENKLDARTVEDTSLDVVKANKKRIGIDSASAVEQLEGIALARDINKSMKIIEPGLSSKTGVTPENKIAKQKAMLKALEDYLISEEAFLNSRFSNFGRKKVGDVYVNEPAKGSLYFGTKDPAYKKALAQVKANDVGSGKKAKRVNANTAGTEKANNQSDINLEVLESVALELQAAVKGGMPIELAALFISSGYQATPGLVKISAKFVGESTNPQYAKEGKNNQTTGKEKWREEHSPPASVVGASIIWAIKNGQVKALFPYIKQNYIQVKLSKADDFLLDQAGLDSTLPKGISILTPNAGIRRFAAAGIDLNTIKDFKTGKSFADLMNVGVTKKASKKNPNIIYAQNALISEQITDNLDGKTTKARIKAYEPIAALEYKASKKNTIKFGDKINNEMTVAQQLTMLGVYDKAASQGRKLDSPKKGISVFDFDDTLAKTKEKVIVNNIDGTTVEISAAKFAEQASELEAEGAKFDFSNFENVGKGTQKGPLADLALKRQGKFGSKDIFVLTARPQIAAEGIKKFLDGIGLNLPLANITGLENGTPSAKGNWVAQKAAEGYNDFYFADDAYKNVEAVQEVLSQVDVNSVVQIAKSSKKRTFDKVFNDILESSTGIESYKEYSAARAQTVGANKGRFTFFNTPSAEDFLGLLYKTLGKGKVGDAQMAFYKTNLLDPYNRAELAVTNAKITAAKAFKALKRNLKTLPKSLSKKTGIGGFTFSQATRVAVWTRQGMSIPGLSKRDIKELNDFVDNNAELNTFVDELIKIQKGKPYPKPSDSWLAGTITSDILNEINKVNRKEYLQEWQENVDIIFSDKNMNKLEAAYGPRYVEALRDQLARMKSGSNRPIGGSRVVNNVLDWLNNSVGAVMFLNTRSAVLQTLSSVNFINFGNNNIYKAGKAFANQPQFWKDFKTLMNSPYLVERRNGLKINVSESEIADAVAESTNKVKSAISYLLNKGFIFTRIADSFAIASGGATFYRNQINAYVKGGMDVKEAEKRAFDDFYAIAEENQQSSNPSKISQQQASGAGRVILAFANTPMQYARIIKRSSQDLINKRGDWKTNVSKIVYYGAVQNVIFNALQNALFAEMFAEDEEEDEEQSNREGRIANGMADSLLRGLGIQGAAVSALKNSLITIANENEKKSPEFVKAVYDLFDFSPPLDSKFRKLRSGANTITWERENIKNKGFDLNNPGYLAVAQIISGLTNLPLDRAVQKMNNIRAIMSNSSQNWQKVAMALGWSTWDIGLPYYGVEDKVEMTPQMILKEKVTVMKKETSIKQQKEMLLKLGLTKQQIKDLKYEEARVKKIIELQEKNKK